MNIVILGGGTAGWLAAYYITKSQPRQHNITLIESSSIGIVNAGEGSTGAFRDLLEGKYLKHKIDIEDFMLKTDSTSKLGIRNNNWTGVGSSYFSPGDYSVTGLTDNDYIFKYVVSKFGNQKAYLASKVGIEYNSGVKTSFAYHFDAIKVGQYFKMLCGNDVKSIDAIAHDATIDENGKVLELILDNGAHIKADFFIDCSGFSKFLNNKLNIKWKSYNKFLSVNTAMPFIKKYKQDEIFKPETNATALSSGWMWDIPLTTRRGCGYIFDDNFISHDQAQKEVELYLGHEIEPIRFIKFDSGCSEKFWHNNVLLLGLSSSFIEPLEATSIHNTIIQIHLFVNFALNKNYESTVTVKNIINYNNKVMKIMDETIDWISIHYQGGREDSDFWKNIKHNNIATDKAKEILKMYTTGVPHYNSLDLSGHIYTVPVLNWNIAGINKVSKDLLYSELQNTNMYDFAEKQYSKYSKVFSYKKQ
jgi:tryptophan halogenase